MAITILSLALNTKRDLLTARLRGRQIAGLLGCDARQSAEIAAAVFEIACTACAGGRAATILFQLSANVLHVFPGEARGSAASGSCSEGGWDPAAVRRLIHRLQRGPRVGKGIVARLDYPLGNRTPAIDAHDVPLALEALAKMTPVDPFGEVQRQNREMMLLYREREVETQTRASRGRPAA